MLPRNSRRLRGVKQKDLQDTKDANYVHPGEDTIIQPLQLPLDPRATAFQAQFLHRLHYGLQITIVPTTSAASITAAKVGSSQISLTSNATGKNKPGLRDSTPTGAERRSPEGLPRSYTSCRSGATRRTGGSERMRKLICGINRFWNGRSRRISVVQQVRKTPIQLVKAALKC